VPLSDALQGKGAALTIDDGTAAAGQAALLARQYGHHVTLFVNPWECAQSRPYYFSYLDCLLDQTNADQISFHGHTWSLQSFAEKAEFKRLVKQELRSEASIDALYDLISDVASCLHIDNISVPEHLRPLNKNELLQLAAAGVSIESHHWAHVDPVAQNCNEFAEQFETARLWFENSFGSGNYFAAPFGEFAPPERFRRTNDVTCFLLDECRPPGAIGPHLVNRSALVID
jgi:peptidoglycan/xylan/chitin deacetylase (PgdA/CDA1 family)